MKCPVNKWEAWADGTYRLTTKSDLLHLMVEQDKKGGWYYCVVQLNHVRLKFSKKPSATRRLAQQLCVRAVRKVLNAISHDLEAIR